MPRMDLESKGIRGGLVRRDRDVVDIEPGSSLRLLLSLHWGYWGP